MKLKGALQKLAGFIWTGAKTLDHAFNAPPSQWVRFAGSDQVLVFVHGLLSEGGRAWSSKHSDWLKLCSDDPALKSFDIFQAEWYSTLLSVDFDLASSADALMRDLNRFVEANRPVLDAKRLVFVCHSMGGLVVRQALVSNPKAFEGHRISILSFGTPSLGASLVNRLEGVISRVGHRQALELKVENPHLEALHGSFLDLITQSEGRIDGAEFVESHLLVPTLKAHRWLDNHLPSPPPLVGMESQGRYFGQPQILRVTDHRTISRPDGPDHPSHQALIAFLHSLSPSSGP